MMKRLRTLEGKSVLIVENEWLIADDFCRVLISEGAYVLGPVASVDQALMLINERWIDAAVLDIHLGEGVNVYPVAELLRARCVPFMFATGYDGSEIRRDFAEVPHLVKPFVPNTIGPIIAKVSATARRPFASYPADQSVQPNYRSRLV